MYYSKTHKDLAVTAKPVPPPIPAKKVAANAYTGLGQDTVGPALYDPTQDASKPVAPVKNFAKGVAKRALFEP